MGYREQRRLYQVQIIAVAGGQRQVEILLDRLLPGGRGDAQVVQVFGDALAEIRSAGAGEDQLHAEVGIEYREDVHQPRHRRDRVRHDQDAPAVRSRRPVLRGAADGHVQPFLHRQFRHRSFRCPSRQRYPTAGSQSQPAVP
ncbi:hypothetical protein [Nocardiopsis composta]|uniref:Uncharacterized protein n=1 Tax=Nocardiopsis composta TaxID=157465 RepID=A0A7W8QMR6_9ACTN|nr:hypothetical protein [Nocardiopsis composta]MBB5432291.1 hypothetical protein [Nocardiopsis composta]